MRATYDIGEREGNVRAPAEFVEAIRAATGDRGLDVWWDPYREVFTRHLAVESESSPRPTVGCWVVWKQVNMLEHSTLPCGTDVLVSRQRWIRIYSMDGFNGDPTNIGMWLASALNRSKKPGWLAEVNDMHEAAELRADAEETSMMRDVAHNRDLRRALARAAEESGTDATMTREDHLRVERAYHKRLERMAKRVSERAKQARVWSQA